MQEPAGASLRALRDAKGWTQQDLSDASGIDRDKIAKIETGARRVSGTDALYLADALGVATDELLGRITSVTRYRREASGSDTEDERLAAWFDDYIEDSLFLERSCRRHDVG